MPTFYCRNVVDRTTNPMKTQTTMEESARNWCKLTSMDFHGIFAFSLEGQEPTEFWSNGKKYKTAARAQIAGSR